MDIKELPEGIKKIVRPLYYWLGLYRMWFTYITNRNPNQDPKKIPIIINNINRLTYLKQLINSLEKRGYYNIYIIDNASTYPPLLEYYKTCPYPIFFLKENTGHLALWKTNIHKQFLNDYYVYTDSDVVPTEECPEDFLDFFWTALKENRNLCKVGFSLKIDDLPDHYQQKQNVIEWEKKYFEKPISPFFYEANIDTTFALYKPGLTQAANSYLKMYRSAAPYEARHMPWYTDSKNISDEDAFYNYHAKTSTHWTQKK